jgi:4-hydroxybenzoate polyprenyltransferase
MPASAARSTDFKRGEEQWARTLAGRAVQAYDVNVRTFSTLASRMSFVLVAAIRERMCDIVTVARAPVSLIAGFAAASAVWWQSPSDWRLQLKCLSVLTFLAAFGFITNDVVDAEKDSAAGRHDKLIAIGRLARAPAVVAAGIALIAAVGTAYSINVSAAFSAFVIATLAFAYSPFALWFPVAKCAYFSGLCLAPFIFATLSGNGNLSALGALLVCTFVFGRETLIDVKDIEHDLRAKISTLAIRAGAKRATCLGWALMLLSTLGLLIFSFSSTAMPLALGAMGLVVLGLHSSLRSPYRHFLWTRCAMLCAVLALPAIA